MDSDAAPLSLRKTVAAKRAIGKHPKIIESPAYDASEEDNDPLSDDARSVTGILPTSLPLETPPRLSAGLMRPKAHSTRSNRPHQLASSVLSDSDGVDSPTYDGDVESSATVGNEPRPTHHHHASSTSTFDVAMFSPSPSPGSATTPATDVAMSAPLSAPLREPAPAAISKAAFNPAALTPGDIQSFVQQAIDGESWRKYKINSPPLDRPVRIYADGVYDLFHFGHALQLRQAKLSFPSVYLLVGVNSDEQVRAHKARGVMSHAERLEAARHCRWVDEIVADAPWVIDQAFIDKYQIDYVAHDEEPYKSLGHDDVYSFCKSLGKFIPTRRTPGISTSELLERIVSGYRHRDFDDKLTKMATEMNETPPFSAETYFATQAAPHTLEQDIAGVKAFVTRQVAEGRNVVLVTGTQSGGTTVPLELNVVRFLDNFSAGTRGATSAEYFLKAGYAVIFMHRQFSLQPFSRHYSHSTNPFLDFISLEGDGSDQKAGIVAEKRADPDLISVLAAYKSVQMAGTLHTLNFVTVNDYLWLLRAVSQELSVLRQRALYYLAAAVSDFFLPRQKLSEHKIQSGKGSLHIEMDQVPKVLKAMVEEWTRDGYILETDEDLLIPKARAALERYGHQIVIGNDLHTRKHRVVFVERKMKPLPPLPTGADDAEIAAVGVQNKDSLMFVESWLRLSPTAHNQEIEEDIISELVRRHSLWIGASTK
ncbi:unnamed protein product [Mycena citricolor]|uniref:choline-phosphate cytidylyltransferase n=1 Tax=Mycena citricolor TaxID=2018698 RepID=A0AAD2Q385_9AGAR|nr:unnamed protein product [Mycena citricolor]CAK5271839.1 unnamed protein product [Mycena citricolor]